MGGKERKEMKKETPGGNKNSKDQLNAFSYVGEVATA